MKGSGEENPKGYYQKKLVVVLPVLTDRDRERIDQAAREDGWTVLFFHNAAEAMLHVRDADVIFGQSADLARNAPALRWLCTPSAGIDHFLQPGVFASPNAVLSNSSGAYGVTIAEHIVMVTLMIMRRQMEYARITDNREWKRDLRIRSIRESRITVLGTGDIGREAAIRLRAFSPVSLTGINRSGMNPSGLFDRVLCVQNMDSVLPETDLMILCLPETPQTIGIMNRSRLAMMPENAFIVNVGRGSALDQTSLEEMMRQGRFAGAALDVFEREPLPADSGLWSCPRLLITPHIAGNMTLEYTVERIVSMFLEDFARFRAGKPLLHAVDRMKGY